MLKPRKDLLIDSADERPESFDDDFRKKEMRRGMDLATTLERIEKNFVITDPRLPDNPIVRQQRINSDLFYLYHLSFLLSVDMDTKFPSNCIHCLVLVTDICIG